MKALYTVVLLSLLIASSLQAQSLNDSTEYNPGIRMLGNAKTLDDYLGAAHYFEKLSMHYAEQWLASYYAGLSYLRASYKAQGDNTKDALIDKAQPMIDKAFKLKPGEPEIHVLQAFLYQSRLQVSPLMRGLTYSQRADASLKKAVAVDPNNPRAFSLLGYNLYYTPVMFGGGAKIALPLFMKAREKYLAFTPALPFMPIWGERENQEMLKACNNTKN